MSDHAAIRRLEALADEAWPAAVIEEHDGWLLRWAEGPWNRTNSVATIDAGTVPLPAKIDHAERWYRDRDRLPVFKLTDATSPPELDEVLQRRGYDVSFSVSVQVREVEPGSIGDVIIEERPSGIWLTAKRRLADATGERARHLPTLLGRIQAPTAYALIAGDDSPIGLGMAVVTGGYTGIFDLVTDPDARGRGVARAIVGALECWGAGIGATTAYLQVETNNEPALRLYEKLGYREVHRYWYRAMEE